MWKVLGNQESDASSLFVSAGETETKQRVKPLLCNRFELKDIIKHGATGTLYFGKLVRPKANGCLKLNEKLVLKTEEAARPRCQLLTEWQVYSALASLTKQGFSFHPGVGGIPRAELERGRVFVEEQVGEGKGEVAEVNVLAMEALGENLMTLMQQAHGQKLSVKTVLLLGIQMVTLLEMLHQAGFVHRDMKPENFCVGTGEKSDKLYLIDFGVAQLFRDPVSNAFLPRGEMNTAPEKRLPGSLRYASLFAHEGGRQTPRADLEAVGFVLLFLLRGRLPWQGAPAKSPEMLKEAVHKIKMATSVEELCGDCPALAEYLTYCRGLKYSDVPDYDIPRKIFTSWLLRRGLMNDGALFEWQRTKSKSMVQDTTAPSPKLKSALLLPTGTSAVADLYEGVPEVGGSHLCQMQDITSQKEDKDLTNKDNPSSEPACLQTHFSECQSTEESLGNIPDLEIPQVSIPVPFSPKHKSLYPTRPSLKRRREDTDRQSVRVQFCPDSPIVVVLEKLGPAEPWGGGVDKGVFKRTVHSEDEKLDEIMQKWAARMEKGGVDGRTGCHKHAKTAHSDSPIDPDTKASEVLENQLPNAKEVVVSEDGKLNVTAALCRIVPHLLKPKKFEKAAKLLEQLMDSEMTSFNSDEFADALGAALGTGCRLHDDVTWKTYDSLFSLAFENLHKFNNDRKADVSLWVVAASAFNVVTKTGMNEENVNSILEKIGASISELDTSSGAPGLAKEIMVARVYDCLEKLYDHFRMSWCPKLKVLKIFETVLNVSSFTKLQKGNINRWCSTLQARL